MQNQSREYVVKSGDNVYYRDCRKCAEKVAKGIYKIGRDVIIMKDGKVIKEMKHGLHDK